MSGEGFFTETAIRLGLLKASEIEDEAFRKGYRAAIKHADAALKSQGDDPQIRRSRKVVLALVGIHYHPEHAIPDEPLWSEAKCEPANTPSPPSPRGG